MARALARVASILRRLRTIEASAISRSTSAWSYAAIRSGSKPSKAARNAGRLRRIVTQLSPDWNASRVRRSKTPTSSRTGIPHSVS